MGGPQAGVAAARVTSADGAALQVHTRGEGPGVVLLHGSGVSARDYERLAAALSGRLSVHRYDRRGRPGTPVLTGGETVATDVADLAAVLDHTGATRVFAHSAGAFVALQAARELPLSHVAVYDPAVAVAGTDMPRDYLDDLLRALEAGDTVTAMTIIGRNANPDELQARLPAPLQRLALAALLRTPVGRRMADLLPTIGPELDRILSSDAPAAAYAGIRADTLLLTGAGSSRYFAQTCDALAAVLPRARHVVIPRARHNAANLAPRRLVEPLLRFFAGG